MKTQRKKRWTAILQALQNAGNEATTDELHRRTGLDARGLTHSLVVMNEQGYVLKLGGEKGNALWRLLRTLEEERRTPTPPRDIFVERMR